MKKKEIFFTMGVLILTFAMMHGCSEKKLDKTSEETLRDNSPAELPILPQNLLSNQPEKPVEPDYSFHPVSNDLEQPSPDQEPSAMID